MTRGTAAVLLALAAATIACVVPHGRRDRGAGAVLELAVWGMPFEDRLFEDAYARGFERLHPGVEVAYERYQDLQDKYLAWHVVGRGSDVMRVRITDYPLFVARGMLEPLDRFLDDPTIGLAADERADFTPAIWAQLEIGGARYALPADNAVYGLYYNKTLFAEAGVEPPHAGWTWDELRAAARRLTTHGPDGRERVIGVDFELWAWPFMAFFAQAGGELWDGDGTTTRIDSDAGLAALRLIVELLPASASMRAVAGVGSASGPDKLFTAGQLAMLLDGSWRAPDLERVAPDLDFAIAPLPRGPARRAVVGGSVLWAVSAHSERPELAYRMIRWMTSREQSLRYWDALRVAPPARLSVVRSAAFRETAGLADADGTVWVHPMPASAFDDRAAWLLDALTPDPATDAAPVFVPVAPYQKDLEESIDAMLRRAVTPGRAEPLEQLLAEASTRVHEIIDRDRRARGLPPVSR